MDVVGSTNIAMAKGFNDLGYHIEMYSYRTVQKDLGMENMWLHFTDFIKGREFDLIVFCKTNSMHPQLLDSAKESGPTWYWFMDPLNTAKQMGASTFAQNATFASATSSEVTERFSMINKNSHHIFEGYDPGIYFYEDLKKIHDVIFIGNGTIPRIIEINNLRSAGVDVTIFGGFWPVGMKANPPVFGEDERIEINQSRVVLNLVQDDTIFSDRIIKGLGCGANVVSQPCQDLLDSDIGENVHMYVGAESFKHLNDNLVGDNFQASSNKVAMAKELFSWEAVCRGIMGKVREYNEHTVR